MALKNTERGLRSSKSRLSNLDSMDPRVRTIAKNVDFPGRLGLGMRLRGGEWKKKEGGNWVWVGETKTYSSPPNQKTGKKRKKRNTSRRNTAAAAPGSESTQGERIQTGQSYPIPTDSRSSMDMQNAGSYHMQQEHSPPSHQQKQPSSLVPAKSPQAKRPSWLPPEDLDLPIPLPPRIQGVQSQQSVSSKDSDPNIVSALKQLLEVRRKPPRHAVLESGRTTNFPVIHFYVSFVHVAERASNT